MRILPLKGWTLEKAENIHRKPRLKRDEMRDKIETFRHWDWHEVDQLLMDGGVLLVLGKLTKDAKAISWYLNMKLGDMGIMRNLVPRLTLKFMDLDYVTIEKDIKDALIWHRDGEAKVSIIKKPANYWKPPASKLGEWTVRPGIEHELIDVLSACAMDTNPGTAKCRIAVLSSTRVAKKITKQPYARKLFGVCSSQNWRKSRLYLKHVLGSSDCKGRSSYWKTNSTRAKKLTNSWHN